MNTNQVATASPNGLAKAPTLKGMLDRDDIQKRFKEILGTKAAGFISSIINVVNGNTNLSMADPTSVVMSAAVAAALDLPIDPNLGFAYIIPYQQSKSVEWTDDQGQLQQRWETKQVAQFQMGYKGFIQLAMRTGQYEKINCIEVHANQLLSANPLTEEYTFDWTQEGGEIVGYVAYFKLISGFSKMVYWNIGKLNAHAKKHSKSFGKKTSPWTTNYSEMCQKTLLKHILSKFGPLSIEMQKAVITDQAVIKNMDGDQVEYADSTDISNQKSISTTEDTAATNVDNSTNEQAFMNDQSSNNQAQSGTKDTNDYSNDL